MINVLLVEDHELYRMGLAMLLDKAEGIILQAEAADGIDGIKKARKLKPVWNKGLTKDSDNRVKELYENRKLSENGRRKLQENGRRTSKSMWYNNGHTQIRVFDGEMPPSGFVRGMLKRKK